MRNKTHWKGKDDAEIAEKLLKDPELKALYERDPSQDKMSAINLVPQDIRSFVIYYDLEKEQEPILLQ